MQIGCVVKHGCIMNHVHIVWSALFEFTEFNVTIFPSLVFWFSRVFPVWQHSLFACLWVAALTRLTGSLTFSDDSASTISRCKSWVPRPPLHLFLHIPALAGYVARHINDVFRFNKGALLPSSGDWCSKRTGVAAWGMLSYTAGIVTSAWIVWHLLTMY